MIFRKARQAEFGFLYDSGYREWPKGRTLAQYIQDNQKEESFGTRYVLADEKNNVAASLMLLRFSNTLHGIGSVVVEPAFRKQGVGKQLIAETVAFIETKETEAVFILYSEIGTSYYEALGFRALPLACQRYEQSICMAKSSAKAYKQLIQNQKIPDYF